MWNLGDMFDAVAKVVPGDRQAIIQGDTIVTWAELDQRTNRLARGFIGLGLTPGSTVGILARNHPAYIEGFLACLKARLVPVNINYRYEAEEVAYVLSDSRSKALIYQSEFENHADHARTRFDGIKAICIGEGKGISFESLASQGDGSPLDLRRQPEDPFLLYTGGTTGRPKGVVWPGNAVRATQMESPAVRHHPKTLEEHAANVAANPTPGRVLPACPLMHGAGINSTLSELISGGTGIIMSSGGFSAHELLSTVEKHRVGRVLIVGDVFARPIVEALNEKPGRYDLSSLKLISSAGLMWSREVKQELLRHMPWLTLLDSFGASEASNLGFSITTKDNAYATGRFMPGPKTVLLTEEDQIVKPGTAGEGMIARTYPLPLGYLGDPKKTAETFRVIDGERYAIPGDYARFFDDGTMELVGRGNLVVNTGGEKVFVEEVEEALKLDPALDDAIVVGLPDERWGSIVVGLVTAKKGKTPEQAAIQRELRGKLASYKIPKLVYVVDALPRAESGKSDYNGARTLARSLREAEAAATKS